MDLLALWRGFRDAARSAKKGHRRPGALKALEKAKSRFHGGCARPGELGKGAALAGAVPALSPFTQRLMAWSLPGPQKLTRRPMSKPVELPLTLLAPVTGPKAPEP